MICINEGLPLIAGMSGKTKKYFGVLFTIVFDLAPV